MVKNNKGFTLIELLVAISIFAILSTIISGIYLSFSKNQERTKIATSVLNDAQYILETIASEIKNNEVFETPSWEPGEAPFIYTLRRENGDLVYFEYDYLVDIKFGLNATEFNDGWFEFLNNKDIFKITYFDLILMNRDEQPRVTIIMEVENTTDNDNERVKYKLQTTVSSRIYK